jgi:Na+-translocating ferredoxin:NAD+ oxidoreductase RNF subunit RnfB
LRKFEAMESVLKGLPGLDCGACGAPNCRALAEDIAVGDATETDCVIKLKELYKSVAVPKAGEP